MQVHKNIYVIFIHNVQSTLIDVRSIIKIDR